MPTSEPQTTEPPQPTYRFRWENVDLNDFVIQRRFAADALRQEATVLLRRADQIAEEIAAWQNALEAAP